MRKEFIADILKEMIENKSRQIDTNKFFNAIEDFLRRLHNKEEEECKTN